MEGECRGRAGREGEREGMERKSKINLLIEIGKIGEASDHRYTADITNVESFFETRQPKDPVLPSPSSSSLLSLLPFSLFLFLFYSLHPVSFTSLRISFSFVAGG